MSNKTKSIRKTIALLIAILLLASAFSGCGKEDASASVATVSEKDKNGGGHTFADDESNAEEETGEKNSLSTGSEMTIPETQETGPGVSEEIAFKETETEDSNGQASGETGTETSVEEASDPTPDATSTAEEESGPQEKAYDFTLGFAGDINFADNYIPIEYLTSIGSENIADGIDQRFIDLMHGMDKMWINNEFVYSDRGEALYGKMWTFRGATKNVSYMRDLGIDIVGLANNHCYDYGEESFLDTLQTLTDAGIPYVGAGHTLEEAMTPTYLEVDGFKIAYVMASSCEYTIYTPEATETEPGILWCYDNAHFLEAIRTAAANADYVIALPHWGTEHSTELIWEQTEGAHAYIDAGADVVIGTHPHILQGIEYYNGKPILYSLGNFWFDDYDIDTAIAELHLTGTIPAGEENSLDGANVEVKLYPGTQSGVYTAWADTEEWRERIFDHVEAISINISIDENGVVWENDAA